VAKLIHVAAAAIFNEQGQLLLALRGKNQHQGGLWEFPGGKVEPGEAVEQALLRELEEELGVRIDLAATRPLIKVPYHYPDKSVLLDVFLVESFRGEPYGREGQEVRWVAVDQLPQYQFPAANQPIVNALLLPTKIAITPETDVTGYADLIANATRAGADWVMLRAKHLDDSALIKLAAELNSQYTNLLLNGSVEQGNRSGVDRLHLSSVRLMSLESRNQFKGRWLGASCHDQRQLDKAVALGLDYVTLSPVQYTQSHPDDEPIGWGRFADLANSYPIPVYALGGVGPDDLDICAKSGGQGVAAISAFL